MGSTSVCRPLPSGSVSYISVVENGFLAAAASSATLTPFIPLFVWLATKSTSAVLRCFSTNSMWAAVLNSILWMLFTVAGSPNDLIESIELVVAFPVIMTAAYVGLIILYGKDRKILSAIALTVLVVSSLGLVFTGLRFPIEIPFAYHLAVGVTGCIVFLWAHLCIVSDIMAAKALLDLGLGFFNVLPNSVVNGAGCYFFLKNDRRNYVILASYAIGSIMGAAEMMAIILVGCQKNWFMTNAPTEDHHGGDDSNSRGLPRNNGRQNHRNQGVRADNPNNRGADNNEDDQRDHVINIGDGTHLARHASARGSSSSTATVAQDPHGNHKPCLFDVVQNGRPTAESTDPHNAPAPAANENDRGETEEIHGLRVSNVAMPNDGPVADPLKKPLVNENPIANGGEAESAEVENQEKEPSNGPPPPHVIATCTSGDEITPAEPNVSDNDEMKSTTQSTKNQVKDNTSDGSAGSISHALMRVFAGPYSKIVRKTMARSKKKKAPLKRYKDKRDHDSYNKSNIRDLDLAPVVTVNGAMCAPCHRSRHFARGVDLDVY